MCDRVDGSCYDVEYDTTAVKEMATVTQFKTISSTLDRAIELKRLLDQKQQPAPPLKNYSTIANTSINSSPDIQPKVFS